MRNFVHSHPDYKKDSVISKEINYDLVRTMDQIEKGEYAAPELLPEGWRESYHKSKDAFNQCCGGVNGLDKEEPALEHGAVVDVDCGVALGKMEPPK